ncbi:unnamed protein product [Clavelina lepadiformis]|uniref:Nephrin n=1 Tax=Clavelina lepadiformis TaxID=159417 RepID=A0ABP0GRL7_CLALP
MSLWVAEMILVMKKFFLFIIFLQTDSINAEYYFMRQPSNNTVVAGTRQVVVQCYIANYDGDVTWSKDGFSWTFAIGSPFPRYSLMTTQRRGVQNLRISDVTIDDDGFYNCQVLTSEAKLRSRSAYLNVLAPPKSLVLLQANDDVISVMVDQRVDVTCLANLSKPQSTIRWSYSGSNVTETLDEEVEVQPSSKLVSTKSFLRIKATRSQNGSVVRCIASHPALNGSITTQAVLNVLYPPNLPSIQGYKSDTPVPTGSAITMTCVSSGGNPLPSLTWRLDGVVLAGQVFYDNDRVVSRLRHVLRQQNHQKLVTCSVDSVALTNQLTTGVTLNVQFPPEKIEISQLPANGVFEYSTIVLFCVTSFSNPLSSLSWLRNGQFLSPGDYVVRQFSAKSFSRSTLNLTSVKRDDVKDVYSCQASIREVSFNKQVSTKLNIFYPPTSVHVTIYHLGRSSSSELIPEGRTIQLRCVAMGGNPAPALKWYRDGRLVTTEDDHVVVLAGSSWPGCSDDEKTCSILELTLTSTENGARFGCSADHVASKVAKRDVVVLHVLFKPARLYVGVHPSAPTAGQTMSVTCETSPSNPASKITWKHNGVSMTSQSYLQTNTRRVSEGAVVSSRVQFIPTKEDNGSAITCSATNPILHEATTRDVILDVQFPPFFTGATRFNATEDEKNFVIKVPVTANPSNVTYHWTKLIPDVSSSTSWGKIPLPSDVRVSWQNREGVVRMRNVQKSDAGVYQVKVTNSMGSTSFNVTFDVLYAPRILMLRGPSDAAEGDDVTMTCETDSNPSKATIVTWIKEMSKHNRQHFDVTTVDGKSELKLKNVTSSDRGLYRCLATNEIGASPPGTFHLKLKFAAKIERDLTPNKVAKPLPGGTTKATLSCTAVGNPLVTLQWRNNNGSIIRSGQTEGYVTKYVTHNNDVYTSSLDVSLLGNEDDVIKYTCVVSNALGRDAIEIKIVPRSHPDPPINVRIVNVTYDAIVVSWIPGFDGGMSQTFLLEYRRLDDDTKRWDISNIPGHKTAHEMVGLKQDIEYRIRMRSINLLGKSGLSDEIDAKTMADVTAVRSSGFYPGHSFTTVIATSCGVVVFLLIVLLVFLCRKFSSRISYRPKNISTDTGTLPTPEASLTSSRGNSPDKQQMTTSFVQGTSALCRKRLETCTNTVSTRLSGESLEHDRSEVGVNSMSHDLFNCDERRFPWLSRNTSYGSLVHDDRTRGEGLYCESLVSNISPSLCWSQDRQANEHDFLISNQPTANSLSSANELFSSRGEAAYPGLPRSNVPGSTYHLGTNCKDCNDRMSSDTMRSYVERKAESRRIFHSHSLNAGKKLAACSLQPNALSNGTYFQLTQPQVAPSNYYFHPKQTYPVESSNDGRIPLPPTRQEFLAADVDLFREVESDYAVSVHANESLKKNGLYVLNLDHHAAEAGSCASGDSPTYSTAQLLYGPSDERCPHNGSTSSNHAHFPPSPDDLCSFSSHSSTHPFVSRAPSSSSHSSSNICHGMEQAMPNSQRSLEGPSPPLRFSDIPRCNVINVQRVTADTPTVTSSISSIDSNKGFRQPSSSPFIGVDHEGTLFV